MLLTTNTKRLAAVLPILGCLLFADSVAANDPPPSQCEERIYGEIRASSVVPGRKPVKIFEIPKTDYPEEAREAGITGTVTLRVRFLAGGRIGAVDIVEGLPGGLTDEAVKAAKKIRFLPAKQDGRMINVSEKVEFHFGDRPRCETTAKRTRTTSPD